MTSIRRYVGGPLDGETAHRIGRHWDHFRDDEGRPISREVGDAEFQRGHGHRRRYYYMVSAPGGGFVYVHLPVLGEWWPDGFPTRRDAGEPRL